MSNINLTKAIKKQGLRPNVDHEGVVVDNEDPKKLGRIRVRIAKLHEGIKDEHLPWCIGKFAHVDGAKGTNAQSRSGIFFVPKKGSKVLVEFQDGDAHYPVYKGYTIDQDTRLKECNKNYPNRAVVRFGNGAMIIVDTHSNELFIHNPGDTYLIVQGDLHQQVWGDQQEICHASKNKAIDNYFVGDDDLPIGACEQHQTKSVPFGGEGSANSGNRNIVVGGDFTVTVEGNRVVNVKGNDTLIVGGKISVKSKHDYAVKANSVNLYSTTDIKIEAKGELNLVGSIININ